MSKLCYFGITKIMGAYCVCRVHNMLHVPWRYYDNYSLLCRLGTQYASLVVLYYWMRIVYVGFIICYCVRIIMMVYYSKVLRIGRARNYCA